MIADLNQYCIIFSLPLLRGMCSGNKVISISIYYKGGKESDIVKEQWADGSSI